MLLGWLLRLAFFFFLARAAWRLLFGVFEGLQPSPAGARGPSGEKEKRIGALVKDPVCGTYVSPAQALSLNAGGTTHYFCSEDCRSQYRPRR
ncbi:MAG: hypothetical protein U0Q12_08195 [Vicinamibacterales bacterium]